MHSLCCFSTVLLNRWRTCEWCPLLRERSYCRGPCSWCEVRAAAKCQLRPSNSTSGRLIKFSFTERHQGRCSGSGWAAVHSEAHRAGDKQDKGVNWWERSRTSRRLAGFPWGAELPLAGVRRAVQLPGAQVEQQGLLDVVHHCQTVAVPEHHAERRREAEGSGEPPAFSQFVISSTSVDFKA